MVELIKPIEFNVVQYKLADGKLSEIAKAWIESDKVVSVPPMNWPNWRREPKFNFDIANMKIGGSAVYLGLTERFWIDHLKEILAVSMKYRGRIYRLIEHPNDVEIVRTR